MGCTRGTSSSILAQYLAYDDFVAGVPYVQLSIYLCLLGGVIFTMSYSYGA